VGKPKGKNLVGIPRNRWEDNIAIDLKVICGQCVDVAYDRYRWSASVNTVPNLLLSKNARVA